MAIITVLEDISVVTFKSVSAEKPVLNKVLEKTAKAGINIDMISLSALTSDKLSFGFTFSDSDLTGLLGVIKDIRAEFDITPLVSSGNCKILIKTDEMREQAGFAAKVFTKLAQVKTEILLVTTSDDEISLLIRASDLTDAVEVLESVN